MKIAYRWKAAFILAYSIAHFVPLFIFHYSRFARAGGATNSHRVRNQSRRHAKKVELSSTLTRVREQTSRQKMGRLDNYYTIEKVESCSLRQRGQSNCNGKWL